MRSSESGENVKAHDKARSGRLRRDFLGVSLTALCGGALALNLVLILGLLTVIAWQGGRFFWQKDLPEFTLTDGSKLLGEVHSQQTIPADLSAGAAKTSGERLQIRLGNRDLTGGDFRWVDASAIAQRALPADAVLLERLEWGNFYGRMVELRRGAELLGWRVRRRRAARVQHRGRHLPRHLRHRDDDLPHVVRRRALRRAGRALPARVRQAGPDLVRIVRIAVNNLAGVPSIVFGVFGLGFFVYSSAVASTSCSSPSACPRRPSAPAASSGPPDPGLLTVPGGHRRHRGGARRRAQDHARGLARPRREQVADDPGVVLPAARPASSPASSSPWRGCGRGRPADDHRGGQARARPLPIDGDFPFVHLERKFMHLGFHIYDVGFQSPNVEAAKPLVFATTLLLILGTIGDEPHRDRDPQPPAARYAGSAF
jgi:hypothetical protein